MASTHTQAETIHSTTEGHDNSTAWYVML